MTPVFLTWDGPHKTDTFGQSSLFSPRETTGCRQESRRYCQDWRHPSGCSTMYADQRLMQISRRRLLSRKILRDSGRAAHTTILRHRLFDISQAIDGLHDLVQQRECRRSELRHEAS